MRAAASTARTQRAARAAGCVRRGGRIRSARVRKGLRLERPEKFGGNATYETYDALVADYLEGKAHPADLKKTAARYVNEILQPVRDHFERDEKARKLREQVDSWQVTR